MSDSFGLPKIPIPPSPDVLTVAELRQANKYLKILIEMLAKAFPEAAPENMKEKMQDAEDTKKQIGFQAD